MKKTVGLNAFPGLCFQFQQWEELVLLHIPPLRGAAFTHTKKKKVSQTQTQTLKTVSLSQPFLFVLNNFSPFLQRQEADTHGFL